MSAKPKIILTSHGIIFKTPDMRSREAALSYCKQTLVQWEWKKSPPDWKAVRVMKRVFAGATKNRSEFRFHRNQYEDLFFHLISRGYSKSSIEVVEHTIQSGHPITFEVKQPLVPRGYQIPIVAHLSKVEPIIKVTNMQAGKGKTISALMGMINTGKRTMIQLRGGYVQRWLDDLEGLFNFKKGEIVVIRGRDALLSVINEAKSVESLDEIRVKVFIITAKTVYKLLEEFELNGDDNYYGIRPEELYSLLGIGLRIIDEVHEDYHLNYRADIYCNVPSSIHLSATLETEDPFRRKMYDIALPPSNWLATEYDAYIGVKALFYNTDCIEKLRTKERGQDMYSHGAFEKSILRDKQLLKSYLEIVRAPIQEEFIDSYVAGQKCLIFFKLVEMCEIFCEYLKKHYPELDIGVYVSDTDESALKKHEIIVSTVESCGTAQDIPNLKVSVLTRALNKRETNEQVKGRLRRLKDWPDVTPVMCYLNCSQVPKHNEYHHNKVEQYKGKVKWHKTIQMPYVLSNKKT